MVYEWVSGQNPDQTGRYKSEARSCVCEQLYDSDLEAQQERFRSAATGKGIIGGGLGLIGGGILGVLVGVAGGVAYGVLLDEKHDLGKDTIDGAITGGALLAIVSGLAGWFWFPL